MKYLSAFLFFFIISSTATIAQNRIKYYKAKIELTNGKKIEGVLYEVGERGVLLIPKFSKKAFKEMEEQEQVFVHANTIDKLTVKKKGKIGVSRLVKGIGGFAAAGIATAVVAAPFEVVSGGNVETGELIIESAMEGAINGASGGSNVQNTKCGRAFIINAKPKVYGFLWRQIQEYAIGVYEAY